MIIKGAARGNASWLGNHLSRTDTNERIEVVEVQSPHDDGLAIRDRLTETFRDWQALCAGTQGRDGLYHANIDPATDYQMTAEQWNRAVDVLETELGLQGQPRAVVLHEKHGRQHMHVVWARTDIDTMTLRSDSYNYAAHERASLALEQEFGHEIVPGKHAKRDREKQPEPPQAEFTHAEWQQAERAKVDPRAQKAEIKALLEQSDSGQAFRAALEENGYRLARGDSRDFVVVDEAGKTHALGKRLTGREAADVRAFMSDVDRDALPSVEESRALQAARRLQAEPEIPGSAAGKEAEASIAAESRAPKEEAPAPETSTDVESALEPLARSSRDERIERIMAIRGATLERQAGERAAQDARHAREVTARQEAQADEARTIFYELARKEAAAIVAARAEPLNALQQLWRDVRESLSPQARVDRLAAERERVADAELQRETAARLAAAALEAKHRAELAALAGQQGRERAELIRAERQELARRIQDERRAQALEWAYVQRERERQAAQAHDREGPERFRSQ